MTYSHVSLVWWSQVRVHVCFHMCFILRVLGSTGCVHVSVCMYVACSYVRMYRLFGGMCVCVCARVYVYMSTYSSRLFSRGRIVCVCGSIVSASYVCVCCVHVYVYISAPLVFSWENHVCLCVSRLVRWFLYHMMLCSIVSDSCVCVWVGVCCVHV